MVCIHCGNKTQVINSRSQRRMNQVWRRRQCHKCRAIFTTEETVQYGAVWSIKDASGALQPFSRDKLFMSLYRSCQHRRSALSDAGGLTDTIIRKVSALAEDGAVDRQAIARVVHVALNRFDKAASVHYQAFHKA